MDNEDTGVVKDATCQCPMGQYKCHHIAAALLFGYVHSKKKSPPLFCFLLSKQSCFFNYENGFKVGTVKVKNMFWF